MASQTLEAAKAIAFRAIETTCTVSAFGAGLPVQMGVVTSESARQLDSDELDELEDFVNLWKAKEKESLGDLAPAAEVEEGGDADGDEGLDAPA